MTMKRSHRNKKFQRHGVDSSSWTSSALLEQKFDVMSETEYAELDALQKVGQRRQRRYLNEKFLRDMNPTMSAIEMNELFYPAPTGRGSSDHVSLFTIARAPENAPLWDLFRSVDCDKQARVLIKWEEFVKELQQSNKHLAEQRSKKSEAAVAAACAFQGWSSVGHDRKKALHRAPHSFIEQLESLIIDFMDGPDFELILELDDAYQRLLAHGLAEYYFLNSFSRDCVSTGHRHVVLRRKRYRMNAEIRQPHPQWRIRCGEVLWLLDHVDHNNLVDALLGQYEEEDCI